MNGFKVGDKPSQIAEIVGGCSCEQFSAEVVFVSDDGNRVYTFNQRDAFPRLCFSAFFNSHDQQHIQPWCEMTKHNNKARLCCFEKRGDEWISTCSSGLQKIIIKP